ALQQPGVLLFVLADAADAAADEDSRALRIFLAEVEPAVLHSLDGGGQAELGEAIQAPSQLSIQHFIGIEVAHLAREGNLPVGHVKQIDAADAALALAKA